MERHYVFIMFMKQITMFTLIDGNIVGARMMIISLPLNAVKYGKIFFVKMRCVKEFFLK